MALQVSSEARKPQEVSYADLQALTAKLDHTTAELGSVGQSVQQMKAKDLMLLHDQMADVLEQVRVLLWVKGWRQGQIGRQNKASVASLDEAAGRGQ